MINLQNLVACRYNPTHKMKSSRLLYHEGKCPDKKKKILKTCPYNPAHKINIELYETHKNECKYKPKIDKRIENEMSEYIKTEKETDENEGKSEILKSLDLSKNWDSFMDNFSLIKNKSIQRMDENFSLTDTENKVNNNISEKLIIKDADIDNVPHEEFYDINNYDPDGY